MKKLFRVWRQVGEETRDEQMLGVLSITVLLLLLMTLSLFLLFGGEGEIDLPVFLGGEESETVSETDSESESEPTGAADAPGPQYIYATRPTKESYLPLTSGNTVSRGVKSDSSAVMLIRGDTL